MRDFCGHKSGKQLDCMKREAVALLAVLMGLGQHLELQGLIGLLPGCLGHGPYLNLDRDHDHVGSCLLVVVELQVDAHACDQCAVHG